MFAFCVYLLFGREKGKEKHKPGVGTRLSARRSHAVDTTGIHGSGFE